MPGEEFENLQIPNSKEDDVAVIRERFKELDFEYDPAIKDMIFKYLAFYDQLRQLRQGDNPKTR